MRRAFLANTSHLKKNLKQMEAKKHTSKQLFQKDVSSIMPRMKRPYDTSQLSPQKESST